MIWVALKILIRSPSAVLCNRRIMETHDRESRRFVRFVSVSAATLAGINPFTLANRGS